MQTKPDLRLFKTSFSANEKIQWSFWKISKISVWSFKINNTPLLFFAFCPDVFAEGLSFLQQKQRVSSQKRWGKTIAGLCWHCLKMVWSNSYTMNTSRLTTVRKTIAPSCKWVSLWGNGGGGGHTQTSPFSSRNELTGTTSGSSPCLLQNPWSFAPLLILSLFNLVQLSHTVSWPAFCWLELRPVPSHIHTHTLFLAQLQNNLHVHIYDLSYTSLSMVLLNI